MVTVSPRPGRSEFQSATPKSQACFGPYTVKVGHVNVRTLSQKQAGPIKAECLAAQLLQRDLSVCSLSEIRWPGTGQKRIGQYIVHYLGLATNRAQHGVDFALSPAASQCLMQCTPVNERIIVATLKAAITPLTTVQVYAPTDGSEADAKDAAAASALTDPRGKNSFTHGGFQCQAWLSRQNSGVGPLAGFVLQHASQTMAGASSPLAWSTVLQWRTLCSSTKVLTCKPGIKHMLTSCGHAFVNTLVISFSSNSTVSGQIAAAQMLSSACGCCVSQHTTSTGRCICAC